MEEIDFSIRNKFKRFFMPLRKHWFSVPLCMLIIWATIGFGNLMAESRELRKRNSEDLLILGSEMLCESGFRFTNSVDQHLNILNTCTEYIKYRSPIIFNKIFTTKYLPEETLKELRKSLCSNKTDDQMAAKNIWKTGEKLMLIRANLENLPPIIIDLEKNEDVPEWFLKKIKNALELSKKALIEFKKNRTLENALLLCEADRETMILLYFARSIYQSQKALFEGFQRLVNEANEIKEKRARDFPPRSPQKEMLMILARSEKRRAVIVGAIIDGDMKKVYDCLWDAIDISYKERSKLLKLSAELLGKEKQEEVGV